MKTLTQQHERLALLLEHTDGLAEEIDQILAFTDITEDQREHLTAAASMTERAAVHVRAIREDMHREAQKEAPVFEAGMVYDLGCDVEPASDGKGYRFAVPVYYTIGCRGGDCWEVNYEGEVNPDTSEAPAPYSADLPLCVEVNKAIDNGLFEALANFVGRVQS